MKLLITSDGGIISESNDIKFGALESTDKLPDGTTVHKWGFYDADGQVTGYAIDENSASVYGKEEPTCKIVEGTLPSDYTWGKYIWDFDSNAVVVNPDYEEPPLPIEMRIANLEATNDDLTTMLLDLQFETSMAEMGMDDSGEE